MDVDMRYIVLKSSFLKKKQKTIMNSCHFCLKFKFNSYTYQDLCIYRGTPSDLGHLNLPWMLENN